MARPKYFPALMIVMAVLLSLAGCSNKPVTASVKSADGTLITSYALTAYLHQHAKFVTEVVRWKLPRWDQP